MDIHHDSARRRFEAQVDGLPCLVDYELEPGRLIITHTIVDPALRGRGLAGHMVEHVLAWLAPQDLQLVAACSYAAQYLQRHPRWLRLCERVEVRQVLDFWFGAVGSDDDGQLRQAWFLKSEAFDQEIAQRFGAHVDAALTGGLQDWERSVLGSLALVLLLDQFTRNMFRQQARAFAGDARALELSLVLLDGGRAQALPSLQRWFLLMPLEHAEDLALQRRCVAAFEALAADDMRLTGALDYARKHLEVIARYGRFPHRNAALGRPSTAEELDYLSQPGAGF